MKVIDSGINGIIYNDNKRPENGQEKREIFKKALQIQEEIIPF